MSGSNPDGGSPSVYPVFTVSQTPISSSIPNIRISGASASWRAAGTNSTAVCFDANKAGSTATEGWRGEYLRRVGQAALHNAPPWPDLHSRGLQRLDVSQHATKFTQPFWTDSWWRRK